MRYPCALRVSQSQRILQARLRRRIAALKVLWKLADDHCPQNSECTTAETVCPTKTNSTLVWPLRVGSLCQDLSNSVLSTGVLSSAMNLCIRKTSSGYLLRRANIGVLRAPTSRDRQDVAAPKFSIFLSTPGFVLSLQAYAFVRGGSALYLH